MKPEDFLRNQFKCQLESNKKLRKQTTTFKRQAEEFTVTLWRQSVHRADEEIRQGMAHAKLSMSKKKA